MSWYKSQSFVFLYDELYFCSFDNFSSQLWGYYSFGLWLLLALKLTIRKIGRGNMVGIKSEQGQGWKNDVTTCLRIH